MTTHETADVESLTKAFETYHAEASKGLAEIQRMREDLAREKREREELETRMNRATLGGGRGNDDGEALRKTGEAFRKYISNGDKSGFAEVVESKGMSTLSDPEGGYVVFPAFSSAITSKVFESSPIRQLARVVTISTGSFEELLDRDEPDAGWVGEVSARPETRAPDLGKFTIPVHETYAMPKVTQTLLDDAAIDIGGWLVNKVSDKFARMEATAFVSGNGVGKPRGFLDYTSTATGDSTRAWGTLEYVPTGVADNFASTNKGDTFIDVVTSLKADYRSGAVWLMNRRTAGAVRKFKDGQGNYLWQPSATLGQPDTFAGYRVVLAEDMPDIGSGTIPVAFGNFARGYTIVDRLGTRVLRDPYTAKPHVLFYSYRRVGGDVNDFEAIKLMKCATS